MPTLMEIELRAQLARSDERINLLEIQTMNSYLSELTRERDQEWPGGGFLMRRVVPEPEHPGSKWVPWRPLNDDGDALLFEAEEFVTLQAWRFDVTMRLLKH